MNGNGIGLLIHINGEENKDHMIQMNMNNIGINQHNHINGEKKAVNNLISMMDIMNIIGINQHNHIKLERKVQELKKVIMNIIGMKKHNLIKLDKRNKDNLHHQVNHQLHIMNNIGMNPVNHINGELHQIQKVQVILIMMDSMNIIGINHQKVIKLNQHNKNQVVNNKLVMMDKPIHIHMKQLHQLIIGKNIM